MNHFTSWAVAAGTVDRGWKNRLIPKPELSQPAMIAPRKDPRHVKISSLSVALFLLSLTWLSANPVVIGSKKFTESYVLGEIAKRVLIDAGVDAEHRQGMGGTIILWQALRGGQIDAYPEYTGTITQEILKRNDRLTFEQIAQELAKAGIGMTQPIGFNNTYALVMRHSEAQRLGVR